MRILQGDCIALLPTLEADSVQCVVTSPPYLGLRDYQTATWEGGDATCDHKVQWESSLASSGLKRPGNANIGHRHEGYKHVCGRCGAKRIDQQLGIEGSIDGYVENLVQVFREVKRVLRADGTVWLNLGDSYGGGGGYSPGSPSNATSLQSRNGGSTTTPRKSAKGQSKKQLLGIPWRVALALQADGWYLRSAICWEKPSVMPESVKDRCTNCYEHVFLLTKAPKYFYDAAAIAEPSVSDRPGPEHFGAHNDRRETRKPGRHRYQGKWTREIGPNGQEAFQSIGPTRNCRNVWRIPHGRGFAGGHFAVMPVALAERCILAGTSEMGCCGGCGAPWRRVMQRTDQLDPSYKGSKFNTGKTAEYQESRGSDGPRYIQETVGWEASCSCGADRFPCVVLDPFAGTGTTAIAALKNSRDAVMIELNADYIKMIEQRLSKYTLPAWIDQMPSDIQKNPIGPPFHNPPT